MRVLEHHKPPCLNNLRNANSHSKCSPEPLNVRPDTLCAPYTHVLFLCSPQRHCDNLVSSGMCRGQPEEAHVMPDIKSTFDAPEDVKSSFHEGLLLVSKLNEQDQRQLLAWARVPRPGGRLGDISSLSLETGLSKEIAGPVRLAVAMMVGSLRESSVTAAEFVGAGLETGAITHEIELGLKKFVDLIIERRSELKEESESAQLQNVVLPTLVRFELALDARVEISDGAVTRGVPVVVAYVDTDSEDQVVWFQMDEARVRELRDTFSSTLNQIEILKRWVGSAIPS